MAKGYCETYYGLYHGTIKSFAESIKATGFQPSKNSECWCGSGVYFYDCKSKALWSAQRTCNEQKKKGIDDKICCIIADIIDLPKKNILDLRTSSGLKSFHDFVYENYEKQLYETQLDIEELDDKSKILSTIRSSCISLYCKQRDISLVIGTFKQEHDRIDLKYIEFANNVSLVLGAETIYCAKNIDILKNIKILGE